MHSCYIVLTVSGNPCNFSLLGLVDNAGLMLYLFTVANFPNACFPPASIVVYVLESGMLNVSQQLMLLVTGKIHPDTAGIVVNAVIKQIRANLQICKSVESKGLGRAFH